MRRPERELAWGQLAPVWSGAGVQVRGIVAKICFDFMTNLKEPCVDSVSFADALQFKAYSFHAHPSRRDSAALVMA